MSHYKEIGYNINALQQTACLVDNPISFGCCQAHLRLIVGLFSSFSQVVSFMYCCPYICFISFLNVDFNVLGDNSLIRYRYVMQTKHLCVLIHIRTKGEVGIVKYV